MAYIARDPDFLFNVPWRRLEELIAGAYEREGYINVNLTPRSRDQGRDIIAEKPGSCAIRIVDQVKAYAPGHRVSADDVRAMIGVLASDLNVSKGFVTTTAEFAPGIFTEPSLTQFMPYRLDLRDGPKLRGWLIDVWRHTVGGIQ
jgi:restriction system protein